MANGSSFDWRRGAVAGIIATVAYTIFAETANVLINGAEAFFVPFRQLGAIVLGPDALNTDYNLYVVAAIGTAVYFLIGAIFGVVVAFVAARFAAIHGMGLVAFGLVAGLVLYALNVFVVFPALFPWFLGNDRLIQSVAHALFGAVTGTWLMKSNHRAL